MKSAGCNAAYVRVHCAMILRECVLPVIEQKFNDGLPGRPKRVGVRGGLSWGRGACRHAGGIIMPHIHSTPSSGLLSHTVTAHRHPDYYRTQSQPTVIQIIMAHNHGTLSSGLLWYTFTLSSGLLWHTFTSYRHPDYYGTQSQDTVIRLKIIELKLAVE